MKIKVFLLDKTFLSLIWLLLLGCLSGSITLLVFLGIIWFLSDSADVFLDALYSQSRSIIFYSTILTIATLIITVLSNPRWRINYLSALPLDSEVSLQEVRETHKDDEYLFKDTVGIVAFVFIAIVFLVGYFIQGERWDSALRISFLFVLPMPVSFLIANFAKIVIEVGFLILRYIIQNNHLDNDIL